MDNVIDYDSLLEETAEISYDDLDVVDYKDNPEATRTLAGLQYAMDVLDNTPEADKRFDINMNRTTEELAGELAQGS